MRCYWISFLGEPLSRCFGVTAHNEADAFQLLDQAGYSKHRNATNLQVEVVTDPAMLDRNHVLANSGPLLVRGVWFPCMNVGHFGDSRGEGEG